MKVAPLVTVLMPVFNGEEFLKEAIESILTQTYINFEFLIINDGSTDDSERIIRSYKDSRIKYIKNEINLRLIETLNKGIQLANGKYIARMDADDVCDSRRLELQVEFLEKNLEYGLVGARGVSIGGLVEIKYHYPSEHNSIQFALSLYNPFLHSCITYRKELLEVNKFEYNSRYPHCEDYELWLRMIKYTKFYNLPEFLIKIRVHDNQVTKQNIDLQINYTNELRSNYLLSLGFVMSEIELFDNELLNKLNDRNLLDKVIIFEGILKKNKELHIFSNEVLKRYVIINLKNCILELNKSNFKIIKLVLFNSLLKECCFSLKQKISLITKSLNHDI